MENKKTKTLIIIAALLAITVLVIGIAYALFTSSDLKQNKFKVGTLDIQILNLDMKNSSNESTRTLMPGDIDVVSFTAKNVGTMAALTRHTIDIYWKDVATINEITELNAEELLVLYPSTMTDEEIRADFAGEKTQKLEVELMPTVVQKEVAGKSVYGLRYKFVGNTLEGTKPQGVADSDSQDISYKLLLNPQTSYLYQEEPIGIDVVTEGMQYTEEGSGTWTVTDSDGI